MLSAFNNNVIIQYGYASSNTRDVILPTAYTSSYAITLSSSDADVFSFNAIVSGSKSITGFKITKVGLNSAGNQITFTLGDPVTSNWITVGY